MMYSDPDTVSSSCNSIHNQRAAFQYAWTRKASGCENCITTSFSLDIRQLIAVLHLQKDLLHVSKNR